MSSRNDDDRPGHHPSLIPPPPKDLTPAEVREKFEALEDAHNTRGRQLTTLGWLLAVAIILAIIGWFTPRSTPTPKSPVVTTDQLQTVSNDLAALKGDVAYLKAHTDSTGLADIRQGFAELKANDEQRSADIIEMTDAFNFAGLHRPAKK